MCVCLGGGKLSIGDLTTPVQVADRIRFIVSLSFSMWLSQNIHSVCILYGYVCVCMGEGKNERALGILSVVTCIGLYNYKWKNHFFKMKGDIGMI